MQSQWKYRVLEALEQSLRVADRRSRDTRKTARCISFEREHENSKSDLLDDQEKGALGTLILSRVMLQMESSFRGHPNYQKACRVLEELPLWSLDSETALQVIDALSSILGLPFRYNPLEDGVARCNVEDASRAKYDVRLVVKAKIEEAKELLGVDRIVK